MTAPAINLDQARARKRRPYQPVRRTPTEEEDRERRKRLWLDRIDADLPSPEGRAAAGEFHVSLPRKPIHESRMRENCDLAEAVDPLTTSLRRIIPMSRLEHLLNEIQRRISNRQVRRGVAFLRARGHLRVEQTRLGTRNQMYPLYRGAAAAPGAIITDTMSSDTGLHVLTFEAHVLRKQESKLLEQSQKEPPLPPVAPVKPIANGGNGDHPIQRPAEKKSGLAWKQVAQPMTDGEFETLKAAYVKWHIEPFDPLGPEPPWYPSEADPERGKIGPPDFLIWQRRISRPADGNHETLDVEIAHALSVRVPFNDLWPLIQRGNRGAAMGAYLKLKPEQTHEAKRGLLLQRERGPLPDDFPVGATYFTMIGLGQAVSLQTCAAPSSAKAVIILQPYTPEWACERDRLIAAGESRMAKLMTDWAKEGKGWSRP
jgi:hypothetical protein